MTGWQRPKPSPIRICPDTLPSAESFWPADGWPKADSLEEISEKLEMFHNYEDEIAAANQELLMEERRKELEKELEAAVQKARTGGLTAKEIRESFEIIMEDEVC